MFGGASKHNDRLHSKRKMCGEAVWTEDGKGGWKKKNYADAVSEYINLGLDDLSCDADHPKRKRDERKAISIAN